MPERQDDNNGLWKYPTVYPGANLKLNVNAIKLEDGLVEAVGLDGRFLGALRPFPGMADTTVHGVPKPSGSTTVTSITNIVFAKYVAIQKGQSGDFLKGIFYIADNPGGTGKAAYFAYRDSSSGSTDVRMLEDYDSWTDFKLTSYNDYDVTSLGRYIYAALTGNTTSTVASFQNKEAPYNKAYFWDFKVNSWDVFVSGFSQRFMSLLPRRILGTPLNENGTPNDSEDTMDTEVYGPTGHVTPEGDYTYAVVLISRKHNLRSYIRMRTKAALGTPNSGLRFFIDEVKRPINYSSFVQQIRANASEDTRVIHWGMPHCDGFRFCRSPNNDSGQPTGSYSPVGGLYKIDDYIEIGSDFTGSGLFQFRYDHDSIAGTVFNTGKTTYFEDGGLVQQEQYDPFLDDFGPAPRLKRLVAYDGLLVGITDVEEPTTLTDDWQDNERSPESIVWSTLVKDEPENFPPENVYRPDNASERFLGLIPCGDHLFAISNASIYRITRSGGSLSINKITSGIGGVSRYGAAAVGNSLFVVTASGVKEIDGNTGEVRALSIMDRIILDDSEWSASLTNIFMEYDAKIGALIFLNTNKKQCYILWESTGAVTKIEDCPWAFLTAGPDVLTDGPQRAYFITNTATVHVIDGARQMGKRSMCGVTLSETVNGTATSVSATNLIDSGATFPANCVGFKVYILSGTRAGESAEITARNSGTNLSISGLSGALAVGDRYSVSPVVTRITLPQLVGQGGDIDPFVRKIVSSMSVAFSDLGGEYTGTNGKVTMGVKQNLTSLGNTEVTMDAVPDQCVGRVNLASTRAFPYIEFKGGNLDFEVQSILVKGILALSEFQSRTGT